MKTLVGFGLALALVGCGLGNGNIVQETRSVGSIQAVEATQGLEVTVRYGEPAGLTIETDENLLPLVHTWEDNGKLHLGVRPTHWLDPTDGVKVTLVTPRLEVIEATSAASVRLEGAAQPELRVSATSNARIELTGLRVERLVTSCTSGSALLAAGTANFLDASSTSTANLDAAQLEAREVRLDAASLSRAAVRASALIVGEVSSGATVVVRGQPANRRLDTASGGVVRYEN